MALPTQPYKGARDFYPEDKRLHKQLFNQLRSTVEAYGYEEYDAPILESLDIYLAKSGEEIVNEQTYAFEDRGGRRVAIRPEMTPTVSRMVAAKRQELAYPLRWYSIPNLWRYERPQHGRLREHWQLNVDMFGVDGVTADHEIICVADAIMKGFKARHDMYEIRVNDRRLVDFMLHQHLGFDNVQAYSISKLIDRMHKMEHSDFVSKVDALCTPGQREEGLVERLMAILKAKKIEQLPTELREHAVVADLRQLFELLRDSGVDSVRFDITLMRGFDYYTGMVFEVFDKHPDNNRSLFGGGRYDGLVGLFGVEPVSTVGFGMGDVMLQIFLETHDLLPRLKPDTDVYVVLIGDVYRPAQRLLAELRDAGLRVAVDATGRKADKQIKTAVKKGIRYALFVGERELEEGVYVLRNLETGDEERHSSARLISLLKDHRKAS